MPSHGMPQNRSPRKNVLVVLRSGCDGLRVLLTKAGVALTPALSHSSLLTLSNFVTELDPFFAVIRYYHAHPVLKY